jgi:hypothetical protein
VLDHPGWQGETRCPINAGKGSHIAVLKEGDFFEEGCLAGNFVNTELLPQLKTLNNRLDATTRQKVISEIVTGVARVRIDTERNFLDVLDKVDQYLAKASGD